DDARRGPAPAARLPGRPRGAGPSALVGYALQLRAVDLPHAQHRLHDPLHLLDIGVTEQLRHDRSENDLPRHAELVLQPAARALLPAIRELRPEAVDLVL